jgi:N,N'-diacetyllegionaminate synthase
MADGMIDIGGRLLGGKNPCFIIAEAGVNHNGRVDLAKKMIDAAKDAGADAVKFQTFKTENAISVKAPMAAYQKKNTGKDESQYSMVKRLELSYEDFCSLKSYCDKKKIIFMSTPHSSTGDVDLVSKLAPAIKVGSGDLTNLPFLEYIAMKGKPVIIGTGMADMDEVAHALRVIKKHNKNIVLMHCTTSYPAEYEDVNLLAMSTMKEKFKTLAGYSDHTKGTLVSVIAVAMGASVLEKHFTLDKDMEGPDHKASLEPSELKSMVSDIRLVEKIMGTGTKKPTRTELEVSKVARKSIVASEDISKGATIREHMLAIKRPGTGIPPGSMAEVLGKKARRDIEKDDLIDYKDLQ